MRVDESNYEILEKAGKITWSNYLEAVNWTDAENIKGFIDPDELLDIIEDLICEIGRLEEKIEDREQDIRDNYRQITDSEMYGGVD